MSTTNTAFKSVTASTLHQRGRICTEATFATYGDLGEPTWHAYRKDGRRARMEINRRKLLSSLSR